MMKFDGRIVQFGFGAVGKSFYEKVSKEIKFNENNYYVITMNPYEFQDYVNLGGLVSNFIVKEVTRDNYKEIFEPYLDEGDLLIDFADTVGTRDICDWCAKKNIMYLNTGEADWPDHWYCIFEENQLKRAMQEHYAQEVTANRHPIVFHHGNNPGLISHFVKAALEYIVTTQFKKHKHLKQLLDRGAFNELARSLGVRMIHVNDIDLQQVKDEYRKDKIYSTWCLDSFWFEMLSEATSNIGTHEKIDYENLCKQVDYQKGFLEFKKMAGEKRCRTYYPYGTFEGFLVPHEETITIAQNLEVKEGEEVIYRPTVMFLYKPCEYACQFFKDSKVNDYPKPASDKPQDCEVPGEKTIVRGYVYPENVEIVYQEKIESGTEYVGVLLMGDKFAPVWVGNRVETTFLNKDKKACYWQTPTITPVAMSALAAVCWMIKNRDKGGIYFPDEIPDYKYVIKLAEKYISKTIYETFDKSQMEKQLKINFQDLQMKDFFVED